MMRIIVPYSDAAANLDRSSAVSWHRVGLGLCRDAEVAAVGQGNPTAT
jgi:hypothetical protein